MRNYAPADKELILHALTVFESYADSIGLSMKTPSLQAFVASETREALGLPRNVDERWRGLSMEAIQYHILDELWIMNRTLPNKREHSIKAKMKAAAKLLDLPFKKYLELIDCKGMFR